MSIEAILDRRNRLPLFAGGKKPAQHPDPESGNQTSAAEMFRNAVEQARGRHQHCRLFPTHDRFERSTNCHLCLSKPDIPADQSIHWLFGLHIPFSLLDRSKLIWRLGIQKRSFEFLLPLGIRGKG